jgi:hypothetical protein
MFMLDWVMSCGKTIVGREIWKSYYYLHPLIYDVG